ncbi:MAG: DNA polymerase III subunit chi [Methylophilaceae bacterium]|nr:DNA polymerase III subunit chi [Methylophilaceae bacterium]
MTQIDFYFNVTDKFRLAVRLGTKALAQSSRMFVLTPGSEATRTLETLFWTLGQTSFVPHCRSTHPLASETPIVVDHDSTHLPHDDILLNLCATHPPFFSRFRRLIEVVGQDPEDKVAARLRYKFYRDRGYDIRDHDMTGRVL